MIAPILFAAMITRGPVVMAKPPPAPSDSWLCAHASVFFCPIFPGLGAPDPSPATHVVRPRKS